MSKHFNKFTIGTDPEFFLRNPDTKLVSAIPFIKSTDGNGISVGTKENPLKLGFGVGLSFDNVALEFASPVCKNSRHFVHSIKECFRRILKHIPANLTIDTSPAAHFERSELALEEANQFGCDPDYNAWTLQMNRPPDRSSFETLRSCGGHVHVGQVTGYDFLLDPYGKIAVVQAMDIILGVVSVLLDVHPMSNHRRKLYGKAGAHRPTEYGVEYRTMSNWWLKHPTFVKLVHSLTKDALELVDEPKKLKTTINFISEEAVIRCINNGDQSAANFMFTRHVKDLLSPLSKELYEESLKVVEALRGKKVNLEEHWAINVSRTPVATTA